jgi:Zn-dependent peptidase ImmA (M78 family)/transcriptional regulator with XRE-family HTH domain
MTLTPPTGVIIGERIAMARNDAGLSQGQLAMDLGVDRTAVAKMESGARKVSASELVRLATALDRPIDWFVTESPPAVVSRREDRSASGESRLLDRRVEGLARDVDFLRIAGVLRHLEVRHLSMPQTFDEAEAAAAQAREWIGVQHGPLLDLQKYCEALGLLGFSLDLGAGGGDAAYVDAGGWGVALVNGAVDPGRRRFNLAHELGHHLFADAYAPEVTICVGAEPERMINAFAAHFLMPRLGVQETWDTQAGLRLAVLSVAVRFRTSWSAVCSQLRNLGIIQEADRATLVDDPPTAADFIELGERWVSELDAPSVPPDYGRHILAAYRNGKLTSARTAELLWGTVREEELPARSEIPLEGLRRELDPLP